MQDLFTASPANESNRQSSTEPHLQSAGKFAAVYAIVAPDETFKHIETLLEALNADIERENTAADGKVAAPEFFYDAIERQLFRHAPQTIGWLKNLARADFQRTVKLVDKFKRREIRLVARLRLAWALLDSQAAEKEKKMREQTESEDREH